VISIEYDNTIEEIKKGYHKFRFKFSLVRTVAMTVFFGATFVLAADIFIKSEPNENYISALTMALCLALLVWQWVKPYVTLKRLVSTIEQLPDERYCAKFYNEKIIIETIIREKNQGELGEEKVVPNEYSFSSDRLESFVDDEMFLLFVNRSLIYIFPKRCFSEEQIAALSEYFNDKGI